MYCRIESTYYTIFSILDANPNFPWTVGLKEFAHPVIETFSIIGQVGHTFFLAAPMFRFVIQLGSIVTEKELKFRQAMSIMGIYNSSY